MSIAIYKQCELVALLTDIGSKVLTPNCAKCLNRRLLRFIKFNWTKFDWFYIKNNSLQSIAITFEIGFFDALFGPIKIWNYLFFLSAKMTNKYSICKFMGVRHRSEGERTLADSGKTIRLAGTKRHSQFFNDIPQVFTFYYNDWIIINEEVHMLPFVFNQLNKPARQKPSQAKLRRRRGS